MQWKETLEPTLVSILGGKYRTSAAQKGEKEEKKKSTKIRIWTKKKQP